MFRRWSNCAAQLGDSDSETRRFCSPVSLHDPQPWLKLRFKFDPLGLFVFCSRAVLEDAAQSVIAGMEIVICHPRQGSNNQVIATAITTIQRSAIHKILISSKVVHSACVLGVQSLITTTGNLEARIRCIVQTGWRVFSLVRVNKSVNWRRWLISFTRRDTRPNNFQHIAMNCNQWLRLRRFRIHIISVFLHHACHDPWVKRSL